MGSAREHPAMSAGNGSFGMEADALTEARYVVVTFTGPNGFIKHTYDTGTKTFDKVWHSAPDECSHIVLFNGEYLVTDRFAATVMDSARVAIGPVEKYETKDAAIMAAVMKSGQGSNAEQFRLICMGFYGTTRGQSKRSEAFANLYVKALKQTEKYNG
jgi:hypothetical protein